MQDVYEKTIKGSTYKVRNLRPKQAFDLMVDVAKSLGPGAGALLDMVFFSGGSMKEGFAKAAASLDLEETVSAITKGLDKKLLNDAMTMLSEVTVVETDGAPKPLKACFDDHFAGRVGAMLEWFGFAFASQYTDFTESLRSALGK